MNYEADKNMVIPKPFKYLVVEDSLKVCKGIAERMQTNIQWQLCAFAHHVDDAKRIVVAEKPELIFIDWALKGGSAFEILPFIQSIPDYTPYIIFNTGYQSENPEIPQEIINSYKVDKYIVKPIWENLRKNLAQYLSAAADKTLNKSEKKEVWLTDVYKKRMLTNFLKLICVYQDLSNSYHKVFVFNNGITIKAKLSWATIIQLLSEKKLNYFITNSKEHVVIREHILSYKRPFVKLNGFNHKIEVVKDKLCEFEQWLK